MQKRTFVRIMIDSLLNNPFIKALNLLVNFCNNSAFYNKKELKFLTKMPLNKTETYGSYKNNKFIFKNQHSNGVQFK